MPLNIILLQDCLANGMPGAKELAKYFDVQDKYGVRVGDWAMQAAPGVASCSICPDVRVKFGKGKEVLTRHSESDRHTGNQKSAKQQFSIDEVFGRQRDGDEKRKLEIQSQNLEIALGHFFARHSLPHSTGDCLLNILKQKIPDSRIVQGMKLKREKIRQLVECGLGAHYEEETVEKMKKCYAFGIAMDESEVNKRSELEICCKIASEGGIESRHYKCLDLEAGNAETICRTLTDQFIEDKIDYKEKMVSLDLDGCSTMQGCKAGVITKMVEEVPELSSLGSSNAHNISNAMSHGVKACAPDIVEALVDIYQDLGGTKGKGLKKTNEFEGLAKEMGIDTVAFKRFVSTRFRSLRTCISPVLHNYLVIVAFYKSRKKPSPRQERLQVHIKWEHFCKMLSSLKQHIYIYFLGLLCGEVRHDQANAQLHIWCYCWSHFWHRLL